MKIILASKSPRRSEILSNLGVKFDIHVSFADEKSSITDPGELVKSLAMRKGFAVLKELQDENDLLIISADTVVYCNGKILGKPKDRDDAKRMLEDLSGRSHSVLSGVCIIRKTTENITTKVAYEETKVYFDELSDDEIGKYISTKEPFDKAGSYAIQGHASRWISKIEGDYFNVVGLPVNLLCKLLKSIDIVI